MLSILCASEIDENHLWNSSSSKNFWKAACKALKFIDYKRNKADPCLFFCWQNGYVSLVMLWVDDCLIAGHKEKVIKIKEKLKTLFDCKDVGEMNEYVGYLVQRGQNRTNTTLKICE